MNDNRRSDFVGLMLGLDDKKTAKLDAAMLVIADAIASMNDNLMACIAGTDDGRHINEWTYKDGSRALKKMDKVFNNIDEPWGTERFLIQMFAAAIREKRIAVWCGEARIVGVPKEQDLPYTDDNYVFAGDDDSTYISMAIMRRSGIKW